MLGGGPATGRLLAGWLISAALTGGCAPQALPGDPPPGRVVVRSGTDMTAARRKLDDPLRETDRPPLPGTPWYGAWQQRSRDGASTGGTGACTAENRLTGAPLLPADAPPPCPPLAHADPAAARIDSPLPFTAVDRMTAGRMAADRAGGTADPAAAPVSGREADIPGVGTADAAAPADIFLSAPAPPNSPALPGSGILPDDPAAGLRTRLPMAGEGLPAARRSDADDLLAGVPLPDLDLALAYPDGGSGEPAKGGGAQFILDVTTRVVEIVDNPSLTPGDRRAALRRLLTDRVNVRGLARFAAGRHWRAAMPSVREDYEKLFSELMVLIYGNRLRKVAGYDLKVIDAFPETLGRESVEMVARDEDGDAIEINWRLRNLGGDLRIEDIDLGGVSFRSTQRDALRVVFDDGGDLRGAVVLLRRKVADLQRHDDSRP